MSKWLIAIILIILLPQVIGTTTCEVSTDGNITWRNITNIDEDYSEGTHYGIQQATVACIRCKNETTSYGYVCQRTKEGVDVAMGSLSITLFLIILNIALFGVPFLIKPREDKSNEITINNVKWGIWIIAVMFLAFNSSIMYTISSSSGMGIDNQMIFLMDVLLWVGYIGTAILLIMGTIYSFNRMRDKKRRKLMGGDIEY